MYDVDGNGTIDMQEMQGSDTAPTCNFQLLLPPTYSCYHLLPPTTSCSLTTHHRVVAGVYRMLGSDGSGRAEEIFQKMDRSGSGSYF